MVDYAKMGEAVRKMKEYKISVPVKCANIGEENKFKTLHELERLGASRVFIATSAYHTDSEVRKAVLDDLGDKINFFKSHGYGVGVWLWSSIVKDKNEFQKKVNSRGVTHKKWTCHADGDFLKLAAEFARDIARLSPDLIMYDDDFKYSRDENGLHGCFCPWHRKLLRDMYGEEYSLDEIAQRACEEPEGEERRIWYSVMGRGLENYAYAIRRAVDGVDPSIRVGFCANLSGYGVEGTDARRLSYIFAGSTKPFLRTIGAPYWDWYEDYPMKLSEVIELERHQAKLLENSGIEIMSEGDVFPRPRIAVSAAYLEIFDMAMLANGGHDGILKYAIDYYAPADYETGYVDAHEKNKPLYRMIKEHFSEKKAVGVQVLSGDRVFRETDMEYAFCTDKYEYTHKLVSTQAGRVLSQLGIPTQYDRGDMPVAAFGEYARYLVGDDFKNGVITDLAGAIALKRMGVDVGLACVGDKITAACESFGDGYTHFILDGDGYYDVALDERAEVLSNYLSETPRFCGDVLGKTPAAYLYENADGQRFFVMNFISVAVKNGFLSYLKSEQIACAVSWLCKKELPAKCVKTPHAYLMCKEGDGELCVGIWNLSADAETDTEIVLGDEYSSAEFIGGEGKLEGRSVRVSRLDAFGFVGVILKK